MAAASNRMTIWLILKVCINNWPISRPIIRVIWINWNLQNSSWISPPLAMTLITNHSHQKPTSIHLLMEVPCRTNIRLNIISRSITQCPLTPTKIMVDPIYLATMPIIKLSISKSINPARVHTVSRIKKIKQKSNSSNPVIKANICALQQFKIFPILVRHWESARLKLCKLIPIDNIKNLVPS